MENFSADRALLHQGRLSARLLDFAMAFFAVARAAIYGPAVHIEVIKAKGFSTFGASLGCIKHLDQSFLHLIQTRQKAKVDFLGQHRSFYLKATRWEIKFLLLGS